MASLDISQAGAAAGLWAVGLLVIILGMVVVLVCMAWASLSNGVVI